MTLAGFKRHLQDLVSQTVAIEACNGHSSLFIVSHGNKAKAFAFVSVEVTDDLDIGDCAKRAKHLPENAFVCVLAEVVDEDAPAGCGVPWHANVRHATHVVNAHGGEPEENRFIRMTFTQGLCDTSV